MFVILIIAKLAYFFQFLRDKGIICKIINVTLQTIPILGINATFINKDINAEEEFKKTKYG